MLKFERERIALKEEQFMRLIHKTESEAKAEVRKTQLKYESQLTTRQRDMERRIEDLEDKLSHSQDESEETRLKCERFETIIAEQR
jgi:hypothetical protein